MSFGKLENRLIDLLRTGAPDFEAAEELINQGANINAESRDGEENVLSEILLGYWQSYEIDDNDSICNGCDIEYCFDCEHYSEKGLNPQYGESMCKIIQFFLNHGFDVNKNEGRFGAQCLDALTFSTFDRYMIVATKLLFDAGAQNISPIPEGDTTPLSSIGIEASFQRTCKHDHLLANIFEATYQVYEAVENNRPYQGIDSYEKAIGNRILKVLAEKSGETPPIHGIYTTYFRRNNCFKTNLYLVYEGGALVTTQYGDFWVNTILPNTNLVDVSKRFPCIINSTITNITFSHRTVEKYSTNYGQPITILEMDSGAKLKFSINFGEVDDEDRAAYFDFLITT